MSQIQKMTVTAQVPITRPTKRALKLGREGLRLGRNFCSNHAPNKEGTETSLATP